MDKSPFSMGKSTIHTNWRTHIFQRGRYTTNQYIYIYTVYSPKVLPDVVFFVTGTSFSKTIIALGKSTMEDTGGWEHGKTNHRESPPSGSRRYLHGFYMEKSIESHETYYVIYMENPFLYGNHWKLMFIYIDFYMENHWKFMKTHEHPIKIDM